MNKPHRTAIFAVSRIRIGMDGRGLTTLVTFMGCPLHCKYCLNDFCHEKVYKEDGIIPREGVMLIRPRDLLKIVEIDNLYFQLTGGGICFGGGEPGLQVDFIEEFKRICPSYWKITIETCLEYSDSYVERLSKVVDYWIVDIKDMDEQIYENYTGIRPAHHQHLQSLLKYVEPENVKIKVPHIPDYNTDLNVQKSIDIIKQYGFNNVEECHYIKDIRNSQDHKNHQNGDDEDIKRACRESYAHRFSIYGQGENSLFNTPSERSGKEKCEMLRAIRILRVSRLILSI